jgi:hypothetical protein
MSHRAFAGHVFGAVIQDVSDALVEGCTAIECGSTPDFTRDRGPNGGGFLIEATSRAQADVRGNRLVNCESEGKLAGFHARIRTPFRGISQNSTRKHARLNEISNLIGRGGNKNGVEVVGPGATENLVKNCVLFDPDGQGGIEADLGASENVFEKCSIVFQGHALKRTFDGFSQRTSDVGDGLPKVPVGNRFISCSITGRAFFGPHDVRGFACVGASRDASFENASFSLKRIGNSRGRAIGYYEEERIGLVAGTRLERLHFTTVDIQKKRLPLEA